MYQRLAIPVGLVRTVVSILHCGCSDRGSIPRLDIFYVVSFLQCYQEVSCPG
jgi:hypothetical protein